MSDYPHLRQRASDLQQQLLAAERKLSEAKTEHRRRSSELQQTVKQLQTHQAQPSPELCALQSELEQMRKTHHKVDVGLAWDKMGLVWGGRLASFPGSVVLLVPSLWILLKAKPTMLLAGL